MSSDLQKMRPTNARRIWLGAVLAVLLTGVAVPGVLQHAAAKPHSVTLTWNAAPPSKGSAATIYNIFRATRSGGPYTKIASRVTGLTYVDHTVDAHKTYFYVVTAVDQAGHESKFSQEIKAVIP
jgi:fibronectin type 3 domain-containing protein